MASTQSKELRIFGELCADLPEAEVGALRREVAEYLKELEKAQGRSELIALDLAHLLRDRLDRLFELFPNLPGEQRALVVGAARYFTSREDAIPDTQACTGLDDDVRIVNHVLAELGRSEWRIEE